MGSILSVFKNTCYQYFKQVMTKSKLETGSELASPVLGDDPEDGVEVGLEGQTAEKLLTAILFPREDVNRRGVVLLFLLLIELQNGAVGRQQLKNAPIPYEQQLYVLVEARADFQLAVDLSIQLKRRLLFL